MQSCAAKADHGKFRELHPNQQFLKNKELAAKLWLSSQMKL